MSNNIINKIIVWNQKRGLDKREFNLLKEVSYLYSEILELTGNKSDNHDQKAYDFIEKLISNSSKKLSNDEIADGFGDIIIYSIGALLKLGYDPNKVLEIINQANEQKSSIINEFGKVEKSNNFINPNLSLAKINKENK